MKIYLLIELFSCKYKAERVVAGFIYKFATPGVSKFFEKVDDIRSPFLKLFETCPGDGVGNPKTPFVAFNQIKNLFSCRPIALICNLKQDLFICIVIKVKGIRIKDGIPAKTEGLMNLKVETD